MQLGNRYYKFVLVFIFILVGRSEFVKSQISSTHSNYRFSYPEVSFNDSLRNHLLKSRQEFINKGDTLKVIKTIISLSELYSNSLNFVNAINGYNEALALSSELSDIEIKVKILDGLANLCLSISKEIVAEQYYKRSLLLKKELFESNKNSSKVIENAYYNLAICSRKLKKYNEAALYLDSCENVLQTNNPINNIGLNIYVDAEKAFLDYHKGEAAKALKKLKELEFVIDQNNIPYTIVFNLYLAKTYHKLNLYENSMVYYEKAIQACEIHKSNLIYLPEVLESLAEKYLAKGDVKLAFKTLKRSKDLSDSLFGVKSYNYETLFEINGNDLARSQNKQRKAHIFIRKVDNEGYIYMRMHMFYVFLISILVIFTLFYYLVKLKFSKQKKQFNQTLKNKDLQHKEALEFKEEKLVELENLIKEKNELIADIRKSLAKLKKKGRHTGLEGIIHQISNTKNKNWDDFNARFTSNHSGFYETLKKKYPLLTPKDHKLCALIKLNFSSKAMASMLGISIDSVHTSRYRLRQKLNLSKNEKLTDFIDIIE